MHNEKKNVLPLIVIFYFLRLLTNSISDYTLDELPVRHRAALKIQWYYGHLKTHTMDKQINQSISIFQVEVKSLDVSIANTWEQVLGPLAAQCAFISCLLTLAAAWCKQWRLSAARVMLK